MARTRPLPFYIQAEQPVFLTNLFRGRSCFLIAGGPSFAELDHEPLSRPGVLTMGMNNAAKTFRPKLWTHVDQPDHFIRSIFLDPGIMKFSPMRLNRNHIWDSDAWQFMPYRLRDAPNTFFYNRHADAFDPNDYLAREALYWGSSSSNGGGRSVMLAAVRILYEIGIRRIFLLGVDFNMSARNTYHFEQKRKDGSVSGNNDTYRKLQGRFRALRPVLERNGLHIYNCNPDSGLTAFDHVPYAEALATVDREEWGSIDLANERTADLYDTDKKKEPKPAPWSLGSTHIATARPYSQPEKPGMEEHPYDLAILTPTGDRPQCMELCQRWMARQTYQGRVQWIVVDDGKEPTPAVTREDWDIVQVRRERRPDDPGHTLAPNVAEGLRHLKAPKLVIIEDDDWYREDYLEVVATRLDEHDMVGESHAIYCLLEPPGFKCMNNKGHASWAAMGFAGEAIEFVRQFTAGFRKAYLDLHAWKHFPGSKRVYGRDKRRPLIVQMKGMPGRPGVGRNHKMQPNSRYHPDLGRAHLKGWIGEDVEVYHALAQRQSPNGEDIPPHFSRWQYHHERPFLIVGRGPTFDQRDMVDPQDFFIMGINHVASLMPCDAAVFNDLDAWRETELIGDPIVFIAGQPHVDAQPGPSLATLIDEDSRLTDLNRRGRLFSYDLSVASKPLYPHFERVLARHTTGQVAAEIAARAGVRCIYTLGIDGGKGRASCFNDKGMQDRGYDIQSEIIQQIAKKHRTQFVPLTDRPRRRLIERQKYENLRRNVPAYGNTCHGQDAIPLIRSLNPDSLLDLGCGGNQLKQLLSPMEVTGVDAANPAADRIAEAHDLPFSDKAFDVVTAFDMLEHLLPEDVPLALAEMARVARRFVVSVCNRPSDTKVNGETLHPTVRTLEWWMEKLGAHGSVEVRDEYLIGAFGEPSW